jgi:hypothetical protein
VLGKGVPVPVPPAPPPIIPQAVFDALEDDFFDRAANLYTVEEVESFKDLEEGHRRAASRSAVRRRQE